MVTDSPAGKVVDNPYLSEDELQEFLEQVVRDRSWALNFYASRNLEFDRMEAWYLKEHYSQNAEFSQDSVMDEATDESSDDHLTVIPIPTNIINSVHGILTDEDIVIECLSSGNRKSEERATNTERLLHGTYWINRQISGSDPIEDSALNFLVYGWGIIYSYWDVDRAAAGRKNKKNLKEVLDFYSFPIIVRSIHPRDIYPLPYGQREHWKGIMWSVKRSVREIEEEWDCTIEATPLCDAEGVPLHDDHGQTLYEELDDNSLIDYTDYWAWRRDDGAGGTDWTLWHCVLCKDTQFLKQPTPMPEYEMLPYEIFFCRKTPRPDTPMMGLSFLFPLIESVQEMEYLVNRQSRMVELYADPMIVIVDPAGDTNDTIEKGPGTVLTVNAGGDAHYMGWPGSPPDVSNLIRLWRETAQDAYPPVMTGLQGGTSGLDTIALQQGGKLQTNKPRRNLELALQRVNTKIIRLLQKFSPDDAVNVMGQMSEADDVVSFAANIKGKDTRGFENTLVKVRGRFPQEELRNAVVAAQVVGAGLSSKRTAMSQYLYRQDPEKEFRLWAEEQILQNPNFQDFFQKLYLQLPPQSPIGQAIVNKPTTDMPNAMDMAGGLMAGSLASTPSQVQSGVQTTPIESNIFSAAAGGAPVGGP